MPHPAIDRTTLDRLVALGTMQGGLTVDDLARALPIDAMEPTDIALLVADLEERGIPVELDAAFLLGQPGEHPALPAFDLPKRGEESPRPTLPATEESQLATGAADPLGVSFPRPERSRAAHWSVVLGGGLALLALGALIALATHVG